MSSHQITRSNDFSNEYKSVAQRPARGFNLFALVGLMRQRRELRQMDDAQLEDLGLSRAQADAEAARPFWDVPSTWRDNSKAPGFSKETRGRRA